MTKTKLLMGASALVAASLALASGAQAQTQIFGGGSTLVGPYLVQLENCYAGTNTASAQVPLVNQGSYPYNGNETFTLTTLVPSCSAIDSSVQFNYIGSGSGNGELSVFTHDITTDVGTTTNGSEQHTLQFSSLQYGAGDYGIGAGDVSAYSAGGTLGQKTGNSTATYVIIDAPGGTTTGAGTGGPGGAASINYLNAAQQYGALIQFPLSIDPVAIAYSAVYKVDNTTGTPVAYKFNVKKPNKDGSGGLLLDMPTTCAIFNGAITNWNDPAITALNSKTSLKDPSDPAAFNLPIELVGRSDSSGTTSIFYRALAAQCGTGTVTYNEGGDNFTYTNQYLAAGGKTLPSGLNSGQVYTNGNANNGSDGINPSPGKFVTSKGSGGVAAYLNFNQAAVPSGSVYTQGRIAYLGPDFVLPAVVNTGANTFGLNIADLSVNKVSIEPTAKSALLAFGSGASAILPPQTSVKGGYAAGTTAVGLRTAPQDWAEPISTTLTYSNGSSAVPTPLANPTAIKGAYPIVGTTNFFLTTCYNGATVTAKMKAFLNYFSTNATVTGATGVLESAGLAPLPQAWRTAIVQTFIIPVTKATATDPTTNQLNLNILQAGTGPSSGTGSQCFAATPGA